MPPSRDGQRIARLFRQVRSLGDRRCCDLEGILTEDDLEVVEMRCKKPGFTACLMRAPDGGPGGLIALAPGQVHGRRRFSIAHELGHYHIPRHRHVAKPPCADRDMLARDGDAKQIEWEANDFAAELLMPWRLFSTDVDRRTPCFTSVYELASPSHYDVSVTAAAWRFIQTTAESCALVVLTNGIVEWVARSKGFRFGLAERNQRIRSGTAAAAVLRGERACPDPERVHFHAWLDDAREEVELWESTHTIESTGQVLSFLWTIGPEEEGDVW